ncbi:MAG TPA: sialidase family protein [Opitutaceae bacterium]|nr:sialidase family protein [Opitutaceae bacterium]
MHLPSRLRRRLHLFASLAVFFFAVPFASSYAASAGKVTSNGYWIPEKTEELKGLKLGPLVKLADGSILGIANSKACISSDDGRTWKEYPMFPGHPNMEVAPGAMILTSRGVVILSYNNMKELSGWNWDEKISDAPEAKIPTYAIRSLDGGKTWQDNQKLHDDWTGANRDIIETRDGSVIFTSMMLRHNPGRHTVLTYTTRNDGRTWLRSNVIDLGGIGHHSGVSESTLVQRRDGVLWMLMRTNWGSFWETFSQDEGLTWTGHRPTNILSSSTPGLLKRLESGRLVLVWNYPYPEGKTTYPLKGGDRQWSEVPVSDHRTEICIMFSDDDGKTWGKRTVIGRITKDGMQLTYPNLIEVRPGEIWITTGFRGDLAIKLMEKDFL